MIYLIHGSDQVKSRRRFHAVVSSLVSKGSGHELFVVSAGDEVGKLEELLWGASLFGAKYIIAADNILSEVGKNRLIFDNLEAIAESAHALVLLEDEMDAGQLKQLSKVAFKVELFATSEKVAQGFNIFSLTDAWAERNKRKSWITLQQALRADLSEEEIFWKLVWQTKNLLLVKTAKDPEKLGMHPYALKKTISYASKFSTDELKEQLANLSDIYHGARRGDGEIGTGVEQLILQK